MEKYIKLSGKNGANKFVIVDAEYFDELNKYKWHFEGRYAARKDKQKGKVYLHHLILNKEDGLDVDHINRNKLDCRKVNLRITTRSLNLLNRSLSKYNKSGHKGICWHKKAKKWMASITVNYKSIYLGLFNNIEDAILAREIAQNKYCI